jgi:hypothetical protein
MMSAPSQMDALRSLCPTAEWAWVGEDYAGLAWYSSDVPKPTEAEIDAERARLHAVWEAQDYARKRAEEYPGLDQLLVALWEAQIEGRPATAQDLQALREAVKAKYPKP